MNYHYSLMSYLLYFLRWQLFPVILALPTHIWFVFHNRGNRRISSIPRLQLVWHCIMVHLRLRCGHNPSEALLIIEEIIELPPDTPGVVIECGAYLGGSTAKLSQAAYLVGRELIVCDSFEGLPEGNFTNHTDKKPDFQKGEYIGRLDDVKKNVARFGKIQCVRFIPGWFEESLGQLKDVPIACGFWDVDLQESFMTCIKYLWPELRPGTKVFLHDIDRVPVVDVFTNSAWWREELRTDPPPLVGASDGLGLLSPLIGYVIKN